MDESSQVPTGYLYLNIVSESLDIDDISAMLELQPTSVMKHTRGGCDHWNYGFPEQELYDFEEMQTKLMAVFQGKEETVRRGAEKYDACINLEFVVYNVIDCLVGTGFDQEFISFAHHIGARIDIDGYFKMTEAGDPATMSAKQDLILIKKL